MMGNHINLGANTMLWRVGRLEKRIQDKDEIIDLLKQKG
jgi:hypothetical protein